jgi:Tol biopolymer transport system component
MKNLKIFGDEMKRVLLISLMIFVEMFGQRVTVVEDAAVTNPREGSFYYPALSPDGTVLIFSTANQKGLWYKNLPSGNIVRITNQLGAGIDAAFESKNHVIYKEDNFVQGRRFSSLKSFDLLTRRSTILDRDIRDLKIYRSYENRTGTYFKNNEIREINSPSLSKISSNEILAYTENSQIVIFENNQKRMIEPLGKGHYIWVSLSPDKTRLMFTFAGKGTFVSDLKGKMLNKVGYANYPSWSPDGSWVVFMKDIDDGVKIISSNIHIANLITGKYFNLTSTRNDISLYPKWGKDNSEVYYNTDKGQIRKINLKIE